MYRVWNMCRCLSFWGYQTSLRHRNKKDKADVSDEASVFCCYHQYRFQYAGLCKQARLFVIFHFRYRLSCLGYSLTGWWVLALPFRMCCARLLRVQPYRLTFVITHVNMRASTKQLTLKRTSWAWKCGRKVYSYTRSSGSPRNIAAGNSLKGYTISNRRQRRWT